MGSMLIGDIKEKTTKVYRKIDGFKNYINAINVVEVSEDTFFTGWVHKLNTPEINRINRSQYGRETLFKQDIFDYGDNNCYISTSGN